MSCWPAPATSGQLPISIQPRVWQRDGGCGISTGAARGAPLGYTDMKAPFLRKMGEFLDLVLVVRIICIFSVMGKPIRGTRGISVINKPRRRQRRPGRDRHVRVNCAVSTFLIELWWQGSTVSLVRRSPG